MKVFSIVEQAEYDPKKHVEKILGRVEEGDVTVACWEPGQISPYHCHPHATEFYFCFEGGGTMRTPDESIVVKPGAFVVPYGTVSAVELDLLDVMDKVVVDDWREAQSGRFGALRRHVDTGRFSAASLYAELGQIVNGQRPGRERDDERILLWHRGLAILDIAVGLAILRRAEEQDAGTMLRYR